MVAGECSAVQQAESRAGEDREGDRERGEREKETERGTERCRQWQNMWVKGMLRAWGGGKVRKSKAKGRQGCVGEGNAYVQVQEVGSSSAGRRSGGGRKRTHAARTKKNTPAVTTASSPPLPKAFHKMKSHITPPKSTCREMSGVCGEKWVQTIKTGDDYRYTAVDMQGARLQGIWRTKCRNR